MMEPNQGVPEFLVGKRSYNALIDALRGDVEMQELAHRAYLETQLLTMWQVTEKSKDTQCPRWRREIRKWEENVMDYYEQRYGEGSE